MQFQFGYHWILDSLEMHEVLEFQFNWVDNFLCVSVFTCFEPMFIFMFPVRSMWSRLINTMHSIKNYNNRSIHDVSQKKRYININTFSVISKRFLRCQRIESGMEACIHIFFAFVSIFQNVHSVVTHLVLENR